jgi:hypothetical protein
MDKSHDRVLMCGVLDCSMPGMICDNKR